MTRRLFALDHNFPEPVLAAFADVLPMVELVPIRAIDAAWTDLEDWELLLALHRHEHNWDRLITNDEDMLSLDEEMGDTDAGVASCCIGRGARRRRLIERDQGAAVSPACSIRDRARA